MNSLKARVAFFTGLSMFAGLFGFQVNAWPSNERIEQIRHLVDRLKEGPLLVFVEVTVDDSLSAPATAAQVGTDRYEIRYNSRIFLSLSEAGQKFVLWHELGHIRLGHVRMRYPGAEAARELELEADTFACLLFKRLVPEPRKQLDSFFELLRGKKNTVPPGPERVTLCDYLMKSNI